MAGRECEHGQQVRARAVGAGMVPNVGASNGREHEPGCGAGVDAGPGAARAQTLAWVG